MSEWYNVKEQSAGKYRLLFLWFVYKILRLKGLKIVLYPTEQMDFQTIMSLYENLCNGDMILMAGDRVSAENSEKTVAGKLLDRNCLFPEGTFLFSKKMKHPTYAIVLPYIGNNTYKVYVKEIDTSKNIENIVKQYTQFIEKNLVKYPSQWYNFYSFFK